MFLSRRFLLTALGLLLLLVAQPPAANSQPDPAPPLTFPTDDKIKRRVEALRDLIKDEEWDTAAQLLQGLFGLEKDVMVPIEQPGPDGKPVQRWGTARSEAERLYRQLPAKGKELYQKKYGPAAADLLKDAKARSDSRLLVRVTQQYPPTEAAAEALQLLAVGYFDRGHLVLAAQLAGVAAPPAGLKSFDADALGLAALCFERLFQHSAGEQRLTPVVLFKAVMAFRHAGDRANADRAWKLLGEKLGKDGLKVGERTLKKDELEKEIEKLLKRTEPTGLNDWPVFQGNASRSARGVGGVPLLEKEWVQPTIRATETRRLVLDQAVRQQLSRGQPVLPAFFPIAARVEEQGRKAHLVVFRSFWGIHAVETNNDGKLRWEAHSYWSLDRMLTTASRAQAANQWVQAYLQMARSQMLFENSSLGTLSTDGERVYAVDDLALPPPPFVLQPNSPLGAEVKAALGHSRLQAIALADGKLHWEIGRPLNTKNNELLDSYFLGPPLPLGGSLYLLAEKNQELRLLCLESKAGTLEWVQSLGTCKTKLTDDPIRRTQAAPLAYGNGVLVCPTNSGAVLGVDLVTRNLLWAHTYQTAVPPPKAPQPIPPLQPTLPPVGWGVAAPIVADGKVVFTAPDADAVHCLNVRDGSSVWKSRRGEKDLYLAGVFAGKVLLVGKDSARALNLADGKPAWQLPTGLPSGYGTASGNFYFLPLRAGVLTKEPEVCAIDVAKGAIIARAHSRKKEVPGNLLFFDGKVLSQSVNEICAYPQLAAKIEEIDRRLKANPKDPTGLSERGALRLENGDLPGAVQDLRAALAANPPAELTGRIRERLYEALTEWLRRDFNAAEEFIDEYQGLLRLDAGPKQRERTATFLTLLARGREQQGRTADALDAYLRLAEEVGPEELLTLPEEPALKVQPMIWAASRVAALLDKAKPDQRKQLEEKAAARWEAARKGNDLVALGRLARVIGPQLAVGQEGALYLAQRLIDQGDQKHYRQAEQLLLGLRGHKDDPSLAGRAVEQLARLATRQGLMEDAFHWYLVLNREFPKTVLRDNKTGSDLFKELVTDRRFLPYLDRLDQPLPKGKARVAEERGTFPQAPLHVAFQPEGEVLPSLGNRRVLLNLQLNQLKVLDRGTNEERWSQGLTRTNFANYVYGGPARANLRFSYYTVGSVVVLPLAHMVFGLDPVHQQVLWEKNLLGADTPPPQVNVTADPRDGSLVLTYQDGWTQRLGQLGPVQPNGVCFLGREGLMTVDPVSGSVLWKRNDVSGRSHLFGDDRHVIAVDPDAQGAARSARAFRLADGGAVTIPDLAALYTDRVRTLGCNLLLSAKGADGTLTLRNYDVLTGKDVWKRDFPAGSIPLRIEQAELAGAIDPDGKLLVLNVRDGQEVLKAALDRKHVQKPDAVHLLRDRWQYYVLIDGPEGKEKLPAGVWPLVTPDSGIRTLPVNGEVYALSPDGEVSWSASVAHQALLLNQFDELPLLAFAARRTQLVNGQAVQRAVTTIIAKHSGKLLYDSEMTTISPFHALTVGPRTGRVELLGHSLRLTHTVEPEK